MWFYVKVAVEGDVSVGVMGGAMMKNTASASVQAKNRTDRVTRRDALLLLCDVTQLVVTRHSSQDVVSL